MKTLTKEECKNSMIDILKYIDGICREKNIPYSIMYGTLIGAVRHGGMIPWDDDIDIALKRDDYYKLIKLIDDEKSTRFKILTWENDDKYCFPWAKVVDRTTVLDENGKNISDNYGLFVDIFPYDLIPNKFKKIMYLKRKIIFFFIKSFSFNKKCKNVRFYHLKFIRYIISKIIGKKYFFKCYDKLCQKYNCKDKYLYCVSPFMFKTLKKIRIKEFDNIGRTKFENIDVNMFDNYDRILTEYYGNYMEIPPEDKRESHNLTAYWRDDYEKEKISL